MKEIAAVCDCSVDTLERRFADVIQRGREKGTMSLKRKMFETAMNGNVTMQIWLSKQHLGYSDKQHHVHEETDHYDDDLLDTIDVEILSKMAKKPTEISEQ